MMINRQNLTTTTYPYTTESFTKLITESRSSLNIDDAFLPPSATVTTTYSNTNTTTTSSTTPTRNIYESNEDFTHDLDDIDNDDDDVDNDELNNNEDDNDDDEIRYNYDRNVKDLGTRSTYMGNLINFIELIYYINSNLSMIIIIIRKSSTTIR